MVTLFIVMLILYFFLKKTSFAESPINVGAQKYFFSYKQQASNTCFMTSRENMTAEELKHIHYLKEQNLNSFVIGLKLNRSASLIRYWWNKTIEEIKNNKKTSMIDEYQGIVKELYLAGYSCVQILDELASEYNFDGKIDTVRRCIRKLKNALPKPKKKAYFIQLPPPGEKMEIDFVEFGEMSDLHGNKSKIKVMICVLPYSKHAYYRHVFTESMEDVFPALAEAFEFFGGVPHSVICDNFKAIVSSNNNRGNVILTDEAYYFEDFFNTKFRPCHTYAPWEKGTVERTARYIRNRFNVKPFFSHEDVQTALDEWNNKVAAVRIHGTTKKKPLDIFHAEEKAKLQSLPKEKYSFIKFFQRKVHDKTYLISYEDNKYSVDSQYVGENVKLYEKGEQIVISHGNEIIGRHDKIVGGIKGQIRIDPKHQVTLINQRSIDKDMNLRSSFLDIFPKGKDILDKIKECEQKFYISRIIDVKDLFGSNFTAKILETALKQNDVSLSNIELLVNKKNLENGKKIFAKNRRNIKINKNGNIDLEVKENSMEDYDV